MKALKILVCATLLSFAGQGFSEAGEAKPTTKEHVKKKLHKTAKKAKKAKNHPATAPKAVEAPANAAPANAAPPAEEPPMPADEGGHDGGEHE